MFLLKHISYILYIQKLEEYSCFYSYGGFGPWQVLETMPDHLASTLICLQASFWLLPVLLNEG